MDQAGRLWQEGKLADRVGTAFTASMTAHGGQESTILALNNTLYHWGMLILPLGYTASEVFNAGGNPYGTSYTSGKEVTGPDARALAVARYQGQRLARYATVTAAAREEGAFRVRRPRPERFHAPGLNDSSRRRTAIQLNSQNLTRALLELAASVTRLPYRNRGEFGQQTGSKRLKSLGSTMRRRSATKPKNRMNKAIPSPSSFMSRPWQWPVNNTDSDITVLLLGPWPESLWAFRRIWHRVAAVGRVVAIDLPGFRHSDGRPD